MKKGFTLIELVIATAVLISVFSIIGMTVNRVTKMRKAAEEQTAVYSQAMAALDSIEDDLRNICSTNSDLTSGAYTFFRTVQMPRGTGAGEAHTNLAYCSVSYENGATDDEEVGSTARRRAGIWTPAESTSPTNYATRTVYTLDDNGRVSVTNAVGGSGEVYIAGASAGDTISVPVVSGTAKRVKDIRTAYSGHVNVAEPVTGLAGESVADPASRLVSTSITFTNSFSSSVVKVVKRPIAGTWPEAGTNAWTITQESEFTSENSTPGSFESPVLLLEESAFGSVSTNLFGEAVSNAVVTAETNVTADVLGDLPSPDSPTNSIPATNGVPIASVEISATNEPPANYVAELVYYHTPTNPLTGFRWSYGTKPPAGIPSGAEVTNPGLSNILDVVTNTAGGTYDYREYDAYSRSAEWRAALEALASQALPTTTNESVNAILYSKLQDFAAGRSFYNDFFPYADGVKIPLGLTQGESFSPSLRMSADGLLPDYSSSLRLSAIGTDTNALLTSADARFKTAVSVRCEVTETNLILTSDVRYWSETACTLETLVPPDIELPAGTYSYSGNVTNKDTTVYSEDTDWKDLTLDEDFEGGTETITGIWLEEDSVDDTKLRAFDEYLYRPEAAEPQVEWAKFKALARKDNYAEAHVFFYTFSDEDDGDPGDGDSASGENDYEARLQLVLMNGDDAGGNDTEIKKLKNKMPDCADIFLLLNPPSPGARFKPYYFYRRVPLKTRNLWSPPR